MLGALVLHSGNRYHFRMCSSWRQIWAGTVLAQRYGGCFREAGGMSRLNDGEEREEKRRVRSHSPLWWGKTLNQKDLEALLPKLSNLLRIATFVKPYVTFGPKVEHFKLGPTPQ